MAPPGIARITHYAWSGGLAAIFEASTPCAAVFGPGGWHVGAPNIVFADGPPARAETAQLRLPKDLVERIASLEFAGAALHTDFVHLDRYVARLQADQTSAVVLVLGPKPAVLDLNGGAVTVVEPASSATSGAVIKQARGWIIVITGSLQAHSSNATPPRDEPTVAEAVPIVETGPVAQTTPPVAAVPVVDTPAPTSGRIDLTPAQIAPIDDAPVDAAQVEVPAVGAAPVDVPSAERAPVDVPPADPARVEVLPVAVPTVETAPVKSAPADAAPPVQMRPAEDLVSAVFGRFAGEARYLLSPGVAENLPPEVATSLAGVVSNGVTGTVLRLLDGAHTLAEIAAETGLTPGQVGGILEALVSHRLAFKYVSRPRPAAGASAAR